MIQQVYSGLTAGSQWAYSRFRVYSRFMVYSRFTAGLQDAYNVILFTTDTQKIYRRHLTGIQRYTTVILADT
jgi:hypothetical protein